MGLFYMSCNLLGLHHEPN